MDLRTYLFQKRITMTDFAKLVHLHKNYISMVARGMRQPSIDVARDIIFATKGEVTLYDIYPDIAILEKSLQLE